MVENREILEKFRDISPTFCCICRDDEQKVVYSGHRSVWTSGTPGRLRKTGVLEQDSMDCSAVENDHYQEQRYYIKDEPAFQALDQRSKDLCQVGTCCVN